VLSLGGATRLSGIPVQGFLRYLGELGIDVVGPDETTDLEAKTLNRWVES